MRNRSPEETGDQECSERRAYSTKVTPCGPDAGVAAGPLFPPMKLRTEN
jgi:hypothetical protein